MKQQGVALITAILVVAIASIAAAAVVSSANIAIRRASTLQDSERAWWYADGLEAWAKVILQRDNDRATDHLGEDWAQVVDYLPVDQGHLRGRIVDLQGRFNVNNLRYDPQGTSLYMEQFKTLMSCIEGVDTFAAQDLANAILDWTDTDETGAAEDLTYLSLLPVAYRTPNQPMHSISELRALQGMTRELYNALRPYVSALPEKTSVNVNTAPGPVLCSLLAPGAGGNLDSFIDEREGSPVTNTNVLTNKLGPSVKLDLATVTTTYFQIEGEAFIGSSRVGLYSVVGRGANGVPVVLRRSIDAE